MRPTAKIKILNHLDMKTPFNTVVEITGYLGKPPLLKIFDSGVKKATLVLYTYLYHTDTSGKQKSTIKWQRITAWGRTADQVSKMLHKGDQVRIRGLLKTYQILLRNGNTRDKEEIILEQFSLELTSTIAASARA